MSRNLDAKLVLLDEDHSGRDEMNLAGNPFALLQASSKAGQKYIRREWERKLANGRIVTASWNVNGDAVLGLPGPQDELLYLILLQISREQKDQFGEWPLTIYFSRRNILERLGWQDGKREYQALNAGFARLQAVTIRASWSFYDPRIGGPVESVGFSLIESYLLHEEKTRRKTKEGELPFSWARWNSVLHGSFLSGNVRSLALDFSLSLESPISRRLFRLLELLRHARKPALSQVSLGIFDLRDRLGMTAYAYPSKIRQVVAPAIEELVARGYLAAVQYEKEKKNENANFVFGSVKLSEAEINKNIAGQGFHPTKYQEAPKTPSKAPQMVLLDETRLIDVRADALRCYQVFQSLSESQRNELLELARKEVSPIWHDRVGQPESPMSLGLWQLVAQYYPEKVKSITRS